MMKLVLATPCLLLGLAASHLKAEEKGTLLFEDDFERNESQEQTDEISLPLFRPAAASEVAP